ncbi:MAG: TetR/AcrR family transcriptional regulator [Candidatus Aminicenantia bacterium]
MTKKKELERKNQILEAAIRCFSKNGYHETTMEDIVQESGLSKGGIYWYFKSKRDIFLALIDRHLEEDIAFWEETIKKEITPELFKDAGVLFFERHQEDPFGGCFWLEFIAEATRDEMIRKKLDEVYQMWQEKIKSVLDEAVKKGILRPINTDSLAVIILACIDGLLIKDLQIHKKRDFSKIWQDFSDILFKGILLRN